MNLHPDWHARKVLVHPLMLALLLAPLTAQLALAQALPSSADPRRVEDRFEAAPVPQSRPPIEVPAPEQAPPPDQAGQIHLTLSQLVVEGAQVLDSTQIGPLVDPLINKQITLLDLYQLRDAITNLYRSKGYVLSQAVIPAQRIRDGAARITVIEGFINEVTFEGEFTGRSAAFAPYVKRIKASRPLKMAVLEREVLLINDLAGVQARTVLKPAEGVTGGTDLAIVLERKPVEAALAVDNRGSKAIGPYQFDGMVKLNDLTGFDSTTLRTIVTPQIEELLFVDLTHERPIGSRGTVAFVGARQSWSEPGIANIDIDSRSTTFRTGISHPLIRSRAETLAVSAEMLWRRSTTEFITTSRDQLTVLSVGASYDFADSLGGANIMQAQLSQGIDVFGADADRTSRPGVSEVFTKVMARLRHDQPLAYGVVLELAAEGQYSPHELVPSEQFGIGGKTFGRAYDPSAIAGDAGGAVRAELNYAVPYEMEPLNLLQPFVFADAGRTWRWEPDTDESLTSAGLGLRLVALDRVSAQVEMARAITIDTLRPIDDSWRGFFSVVVRY